MFTCSESGSRHLIPSCTQQKMRSPNLYLGKLLSNVLSMYFYIQQFVYIAVQKYMNLSLSLQFWKSSCKAYTAQKLPFQWFRKERKRKGPENWLKQNCSWCQDTVKFKYQHKDLLYLYTYLKQTWRYVPVGVCATCTECSTSQFSCTILLCTWSIWFNIHLTFLYWMCSWCTNTNFGIIWHIRK